MPLLSPAELASIQATANSSLDQSITIQRQLRTPDGTGHYTEAWSTIATVLGNLSQPTQTMMQNYDAFIGALKTWQVRLPVGTNVLENDQLSVGGKTLRVQVVLIPQSYQASLRVLASEIE